jgi:hypothetical protein
VAKCADAAVNVAKRSTDAIGQFDAQPRAEIGFYRKDGIAIDVRHNDARGRGLLAYVRACRGDLKEILSASRADA